MDPDYFSRMGEITISLGDMILALLMQAQITTLFDVEMYFSAKILSSYSANTNKQMIFLFCYRDGNDPFLTFYLTVCFLILLNWLHEVM